MELLGPILDIAKFMGTSICQCLEYHRNLESLDTELEGLNSRKKDIDCKLDIAQLSGKKPTHEVRNWLAKVKSINNEISLVKKKREQVKYLWGACLGKQVEEMIKKVEVLRSRDLHDLTTDEPTNKELTVSTTKLVGFTAENNLKEIWKYLMDDEVRKIGVYGMGGVGKTTIMTHVNEKLKKDSGKFDNVIRVTVGQLDVAKLQNRIATALKAELSKEEDIVTGAEKLYRMLEERKRYVLILDDLWDDFPLEKVGIPEPSTDNGCKLVITTRSTEICHRMSCKVVQVKPLSWEEALDLFQDKVGCGILQDPTIKEIVHLIVKQCAGLPLAIVTIGSNMKVDDAVHEWSNALNELRGNVRSIKGLETGVFGQLQLSYDHLKDPKIRYCFLYCALFPQGFKIPREELIEYWIDEGFIKDLETRLEMNNRGHVFLNSLEKNCLLERVENGKYVKMHNLFRAMALRITSKSPLEQKENSTSPRFMVKVGIQVQDLPPEDEWRDVEKVSLMRTSITEIPPDMSPECQKLSTLLLQQNSLKKIPKSFFTKMVTLKILELSYTLIEDLPESIFDLEKLTALLLEGCRGLTHVPDLISKLQELQKLVLRDTSITEVPQDMAKLKKLRYLDVRTSTLKKVPDELLQGLPRLQHLTFDVTSVKNTVFMKGKEVAELRKLETFEGKLYDVNDLNMYVKSLPGREGPNNKYHIQVGNYSYEASYDKCVSINGFSICGDSLVLPTNIQQLNLSYCDGVRSLSGISDATDLRCCRIRSCKGIEGVFSYRSTPLQSLQELHLSNLENLSVLIEGGEAAAVSASPPTTTITTGTFSHLRIIWIYNCPKIKKLFSPGLLRYLQNLEEINVSSCDQMEKIIADDEEENRKEEGTDAVTKVTLPKFRRLILWALPKLKSICSRRAVLVCDSLQQIEVIKCPKLKRMPFSLPLLHNSQPSPPPSLKRIEAYPKEWWESVEWDQPKAKDVLRLLCVFRSL